MNMKILIRCNLLWTQIRSQQSKVLFAATKFRLLQAQKPQSLVANFSRGTGAPILRCSTSTVCGNQQSASEMSAQQLTVGHDEKNKQFCIIIEELDPNAKAQLDYDWVSEETHVDMYHTGVPPQFQGRGIAKHLAKAAFDHFSEKGVTMRPSCTYLQKYLRENPLPKYMDHVEKEFLKRF